MGQGFSANIGESASEWAQQFSGFVIETGRRGDNALRHEHRSSPRLRRVSLRRCCGESAGPSRLAAPERRSCRRADLESETKLSFGMGGGLAYFVSQSLALEGRVGLQADDDERFGGRRLLRSLRLLPVNAAAVRVRGGRQVPFLTIATADQRLGMASATVRNAWTAPGSNPARTSASRTRLWGPAKRKLDSAAGQRVLQLDQHVRAGEIDRGHRSQKQNDMRNRLAACRQEFQQMIARALGIEVEQPNRRCAPPALQARAPRLLTVGDRREFSSSPCTRPNSAMFGCDARRSSKQEREDDANEHAARGCPGRERQRTPPPQPRILIG